MEKEQIIFTVSRTSLVDKAKKRTSPRGSASERLGDGSFFGFLMIASAEKRHVDDFVFVCF